MFAGPMELVVLFLFFGNGMGGPLGVPPQPVDVKIDRAAPDDCLAYFAWVESGEPSSKSENRYEKVLADLEFRELSKALWKQLDVTVAKLTANDQSPESKALVGLVTQGTRQLLKGPGAIYLADFALQPDGIDVDAGLMLGVGEAGPSLVKRIDQFLAAILQAPPAVVQVDGVAFHQAALGPGIPPLTWGLHQDYLFFGVGEDAIASSVARTKTPVPSWLTRATQLSPVQKRSTVAYLNVKKALKLQAAMAPDPDVRSFIKASGLQNLTHLSAVSGVAGEEMVSRVTVGVDGKREGFLAAAGDGQLKKEDLRSIPADAAAAIALRINAGKAFDKIIETLMLIEPRVAREFESGFLEISRELQGYDVRRELLPALGDVWTAHATANEGSLITGWLFRVAVKDRAAAERGMKQVLAQLEKVSERDKGRGRAGALQKIVFAGEELYYLAIPDDDVPMVPTWCLRKNEFVFSLWPQALKNYLSRKPASKSLDAVSRVANLFVADRLPTVVVYSDTRELFKWAYPVTQVGVNVALAELRRSGVELDASLLPSPGAIAPHLGPSVTALYLQNTGVYIDRRQSVPGVSGVALWVQGMMLYTLPARNYRRQIDFEQMIEEEPEIPR